MLIVTLILLQILIFAGLIFMFRRIMNRNIVSATRHLDGMNKEYTEKEKDLDRRLEEVKQQSQEILARTQSEAEKRKAEIIKQAESEKDNLLKQARTQSDEIIEHAEKSRQLLISEIEERISKEAINKACELIQNTLSEEFKKEVHKRWVEELIEDGFKQLGRLKIPEDIHEVKIASAFRLTEEQRKDLLKKLKDVLHRDVKLKEEDDPKVVAGLIITIGSLVLDGSLKNRIQEQAKRD